MKLLSVEAAREVMLAAATPLPTEPVALQHCLGRTLRADVLASRDQPPFDASAMDGWAVIAAAGAGRRRIVGESAAGHPFSGKIGGGEAVRIFTGAPVPDGADAIVIQEDAVREGDLVAVPAAPSGAHLRRAGHDFRAGQRLLAAPCRLDPWRLGLAAAAGLGVLEVSRLPRVTVIPTGEEVVPAGTAAGSAQIYDSGGPSLAALVECWGGIAQASAPIGDDASAIAAAAQGAACDLIVTLGGASVGDHDLVKPALAELGLTLRVESVAVRPGKPTWFGVLGDGRLVLGLPGNPASALVCAELFLRPLLEALLGEEPIMRLVPARSSQQLAANGPREHWMRARLRRGEDAALIVEPFVDQDSALVTIFAAADALLRRCAGAPATAAGDVVDVLPLMRA
ncbi:MAG TPA: gephyrin-like molybdotransferase Glp [Caulobacteraceae bacterium]|nr:gephyrin-like molybdotransferase Glp [Caulobacteraceae bacterium]